MPIAHAAPVKVLPPPPLVDRDATWVFPRIGGFYPPKWMVKIRENPYEQMDDLGVLKTHPYFWKHPLRVGFGFLSLSVCISGFQTLLSKSFAVSGG